MTGSSFRKIGSAVLLLAIAFTFLLISGSGAMAQPNGEKLFKDNCTQCHSAGTNKVIGPGLHGVDEKHSEEWLLKWIKNSQALVKAGDAEAVKVFNEYGKVVMPSQNVNDEEIKAVLGYIKAYKIPAADVPKAALPGAEPAEKEFPWMLVLVILVLGILTVVLGRVKKGLERAVLIKDGQPVPEPVSPGRASKNWIRGNKKLIAVALVLFTVWGSVKGWYALAGIGISQEYQPAQPIKFSHKLHAGQDKINCQYCHSGVEKSKSAGIPSANVCMNCHKYVQEGPVYGKDEIAKIYAALDYDPGTGVYGPNPKPIQWIRVHNLPDLAYFNHSQHVKVGKIECQQCHGPVEEYDYDGMKQFSPLTMGWCIDCHRKTEVKTEGNAYYTDYHKKFLDKFGPEAKMTVEKIGGTECSRCHY